MTEGFNADPGAQSTTRNYHFGDWASTQASQEAIDGMHAKIAELKLLHGQCIRKVRELMRSARDIRYELATQSKTFANEARDLERSVKDEIEAQL